MAKSMSALEKYMMKKGGASKMNDKGKDAADEIIKASKSAGKGLVSETSSTDVPKGAMASKTKKRAYLD